MADIRILEKTLKALANKRRLEILRHLKSSGKTSVGNIAVRIKLSFAATSRHLNILESVGLLEREQINLSVFYNVSMNQKLGTKDILSML